MYKKFRTIWNILHHQNCSRAFAYLIARFNCVLYSYYVKWYIPCVLLLQTMIKNWDNFLVLFMRRQCPVSCEISLEMETKIVRIDSWTRFQLYLKLLYQYYVIWIEFPFLKIAKIALCLGIRFGCFSVSPFFVFFLTCCSFYFTDL